MFDINFRNENFVSLSGRFSAAVINDAEKVLSQIKEDCILDFKDLQYISSAGIGLLLKTYKRLKESDNTLKLINLNQHIKEVLKYSGLDKVLNIE